MHALPNMHCMLIWMGRIQHPLIGHSNSRLGSSLNVDKHAHILTKLVLDILARAGVTLCQCCRQPLRLNKQDRHHLHESQDYIPAWQYVEFRHLGMCSAKHIDGVPPMGGRQQHRLAVHGRTKQRCRPSKYVQLCMNSCA